MEDKRRQIPVTAYLFDQVGNTFLRAEERIIPWPCIAIPCVSPRADLDIKTKVIYASPSGKAEEAYLTETVEELYGRGNSGINLDTFFDELNLQSNVAENFITSEGKISQWTDLSAKGRNAVQATGDNQPELVGLDPTFNGSSSRLTFTEFSKSVYSLYIVHKLTAPPTALTAIMGATSVNNRISFPANTRQIDVNNAGSSGGSSRQFNLYGEEYYQVLSIRRNGGLETVRCNGRYLRTVASTNAVEQAFGVIGCRQTSNFYAGVIKAVCMSSEFVDETTDDSIINALYTRYSLPETSDAIVGFGDSITVGQGATTPLTGGWLPLLATSLGRPRKNFGISGSRLTAFDTNSGVTRYNTQVIERPYSDTLCILYGTNDVEQVSGSDYQAALETVLNGFINAGYSKSKIIVGTIPYRQGDDASTQVADYNSRIESVCAALGLSDPADVYNSMKNGGGDSLMSDTLHPNDDGHAVIASAFAARITS